MPKLEFHADSKQGISHLVNAINQKDLTPYVTVVIENREVAYLIGGQSDFPFMVQLPLSSDWGLKKGQWSLCASSFSTWWQAELKNTIEQTPISIEVEYDKQQKLPLLNGLMAQVSRLYIQAKPPIEAHLAFLEQHKNQAYQSLPTDSARVILEIADCYQPFDVFELNKEQQNVRIERDNSIKPYALPENMVTEHSILLNKESVVQMESICQETDAKQIHYYLDDERAVFSDGVRVVSSSLASLREYRLKKETAYRTEVKIIINIFDFKEDLKKYLSITPLKKANQALLYIDEDYVMLASLVEETGSNRFIRTKHIECDKPSLYSINLSQLSRVQIKDITSAEQMKITVLINEQGELKLGFYNDRDNTDPYQSITDIEYASPKMELVQQSKAKLEIMLKQQDTTGDEDNQDDLFGFEDV
ncbi:hypothetical protein EKG38_24445 [Shewanella canadensis]|uniref:Uncharacterized protein n=1 Tax=Shewanella canadensis TaxID=271096 RepID=A0A431WKZ8_9GAMM|nr:hypothetical protein [Shewanella canadensis]RTR35895.1 hypothetical protein EKG38_24445 [Shewanella canadensis]